MNIRPKRHLCFLLKTWARSQGVYGQPNGYPSGLGFTCLGIFLGQCLAAPFVGRIDPAAVPPFAEVGPARLGPVAARGRRRRGGALPRGPRRAPVPHRTRVLRGRLRLGGGGGLDPARAPMPARPRRGALHRGSRAARARPYMDAERSARLREEFRRGRQLLEGGRWDELFAAASG